MTRLDEFSDKLTILDGAWGTRLRELGLPSGESCERWNLEAPDNVAKIAESYVNAGSRIILTNSFQGSLIALSNHGLADRVFEINRLAVELSRRAAGDRALVFASIGPSGKMLLMGDVTETELLRSFVDQVKGLAAGGPDGVVIETFADLEEWKLAIRAVKDNCDLPVVGSMTFDSGPDHSRTMMGVSVADAITAAEELQIDAVGANCGVGIEAYIETARSFREGTKLPVWIKPNAGLPVQQAGQVVYKQTPTEFAQHAKKLIDLGINFIGGCCGTTPEHIRQLALISH